MEFLIEVFGGVRGGHFKDIEVEVRDDVFQIDGKDGLEMRFNFRAKVEEPIDKASDVSF